VTGASVSLVPGVIPALGSGSVSAESIDLPNIVELDPVSTSTRKHSASRSQEVATLLDSDLTRELES
jgi:hypothetical protein